MRIASADDLDGIVRALTSAFWRLFATSALRYPCTFVTPGCASLWIWLPPRGHAAAQAIGVVSAQFEELRPTESHYYLNFLTTHVDHRGRGLRMGLLRENLTRIDALGAAAYLESTNPANNARYQAVGFEPRGPFTTRSGHVATTMWRALQSYPLPKTKDPARVLDRVTAGAPDAALSVAEAPTPAAVVWGSIQNRR